MSIQTLSAKQISFAAFVRTFNAAYADYFLAIELDTKRMRTLIERDAIDLEASQVVLQDDQPVGVGMLAIEQGRGWIGGLGVLPNYRGHGLGRALMEGLLEAARLRNVAQVYLEVLTQNTKAYNLYRSLGFQTVRRLLVLEGKPRHPSPPLASVEAQPLEAALKLYYTFHQSPNPWQRRYAALTALDMDCWIAHVNGQAAAYCMGWVTPEHIRFMDIAVMAGQTNALVDLLHHVHSLEPDPKGSIINIPESELAARVLQDCGYAITNSQYEMRLDLT